MERSIFKTFESNEGLKTFESAEGFMAILKSSFLALMLALSVNAIEPSQKAIEMTNRLKNNKEVSCCELKREYRRMALELHPDKGGTDEDMAHLNNARDTRDDCSQQKMRGCSKTSTKGASKNKSSKSTKNKSSKSTKNKSSKSTENKSSKSTKNKSSKNKSSKNKSSKNKSDQSKKTQGKSFDSGRLFAGGVLAGGVVGLVVNAMGERKSPKPHVRHPTSPRHS
jgi:hypothetical protein